MNQPEFLAAVFKNPINREIVDRLPVLGATDAWLVSGSLFQSVWNAITGRPAKYGIKDYDIFYFDPNPSW
ncbi:MAG TPA: nucleotidyltransferase family protein, partial [Candidatus Binataceae bacterium]|nr:nucleotidyltransferase family protein [Candidatus Binataceae bacterium]